jgi:hypothetical protein
MAAGFKGKADIGQRFCAPKPIGEAHAMAAPTGFRIKPVNRLGAGFKGHGDT